LLLTYSGLLIYAVTPQFYLLRALQLVTLVSLLAATASRSSLVLKNTLRVVTVLEGLLLTVQYLCQFSYVATLACKSWPYAASLSLDQIGIVFCDDPAEMSGSSDTYR